MSPRPLILRRNLFTSDRLVAGFLGVLALGLAFLIAHDIFFPPAAPVGALLTRAVTMGTVRSAVTATGTLVPAAQQSLGFRSAGTLTEVDVRVGDHVAAGQVLAKIDPSSAQLALQQVQASLASAQANLSNTLNGTALTQAQHSLDQARQSYSDAVNQVNQTNTNDQNQVNADAAQLNADQAQLNADRGSAFYQSYQTAQAGLQNAYNSAVSNWLWAGCNTASGLLSCSSPNGGYSAALNTARADLNALSSGTGAISVGSPYTYLNPQLSLYSAANTAVNADNTRVAADNAKYGVDASKFNSDQQVGQRSITQAQNSVTNAQDAFNTQAVNRPVTIQQQEAAVAGAQAAVNSAQTNLDATTLVAPMTGVITTVTGQAGDSIGATTASSGAQAPGTTAPLPASGTGTGTSSAFMVLMNDKAFQAIVSFAESDAAKVQALQSGTVTFDALANLTIPVHVLAVAASPTVSSNVVNYYVTLTLDNLDSRLKSGLTTNATVTTANAPNVLVVPNSAVTRLGGGTFVNLDQNGKSVRTRIQTGIVGDTLTEVTQGLSVGDKVVLPQLRTTTGTTRAGTAGGGIQLGGAGGGGGGGARGGGG
jgi:multidrug efflux pump subunit AcrA (membrane-fusion protein)